jgi:UDP-GlcNAc:undecaprenyl-phosphate GlcNAc-1-phosphate transferase
MSERIANGRSPFVADKNHFHHRIMRLGFYHTESVFLIYVIQAFLITAAIVFRYHSEWMLLGSYLVISGLILVGFWVAEKAGWKIKRFDLIDRVIKGRLKAAVEQGLLIKLSFRVLEYGLPVLVFFTCFLPQTIPGYFSMLSAALLVVLLSIWLCTKNWLRRGILSMSLYLFIPFLIYMGVEQAATLMAGAFVKLYALAYLLLIVFVILTLKFSQRKKGFHVTTMDFLILIPGFHRAPDLGDLPAV